MDRPRVALAMPRYGNVNFMSVLRFLAQCTAGDVEIPEGSTISVGTSLLQHTFNECLAHALDLRDEGKVTHFAMLHSDIEPQEGWLDILWREMQAHDADLISVVSPIKNTEGKTSTALGAIDDPWRITRYITSYEATQLPATFGPEDVCGPGEVLLINTGCWLADLRRPWWDDFAFNIHSKITRPEQGKRYAETRPEDWEMSRSLREAGARYFATTAVRLIHYGEGGWANFLPTPAPAAPEASDETPAETQGDPEPARIAG